MGLWRASDFVPETLNSILAQRDVELIVRISVDGADTESAEACAPFLADSRCTLTIQPERLGWVGNIAWLLTRAEGDYVCIQPHDDLLAESYLATLLDAAERQPEAAVLYSDIEAFGTLSGRISQPSVSGSAIARQLSLLLDHFPAVAYRGLTRIAALRQVGVPTGNAFDDYAVDTVWMARLARVGELQRVPLPLYWKRYHAGNTHSAWSHWARERKIAAWADHCADMLAEALKVATHPALRVLFARAGLLRAVMSAGPRGAFADIASFADDEERKHVARTFTRAARLHPEIGWDDIAGAHEASLIEEALYGLPREAAPRE